jgi:hypothetical protein
MRRDVSAPRRVTVALSRQRRAGSRHVRTFTRYLPGMPGHTQILDVRGTDTLTFYCGELPADAAISATGHEPNGYFWEGVAAYLDQALAARLELDSEAGMFSASGSRADLEDLQAKLEPLLSGQQDIRGLITRAEADGFEFDD